MNDRTEGALEALAWALTVTTGKGKQEIQIVINDLLANTAVDFRDRVRMHA